MQVLADATVARNFAVLGWVDQLVALADGTVAVAHGVLGIDDAEGGEIEGIRAAFEAESLRHAGSPTGSTAAVAVVGLDDLIARRSSQVVVLLPDAGEIDVAVRLQAPEEREWRRGLGMRARRLDAGEAVSVAIATARGLALGCDDDDGRIAYTTLGGINHYWTLDLVQEAVARRLLAEADARTGYRTLCERYRFWGAPWP